MTHPLCYEELEASPVLKKKKKNHHCMPHSMAKTIVSSVPPPPPHLPSVSIPKKLYQVIRLSRVNSIFHDETKFLLRVEGGGAKSYDDRGL